MATKLLEIFEKKSTRIKSIAFHPYFPIFATAHHNGIVNLWDQHSHSITLTLSEHQGSVRCVKFHYTGEYFATAGDDKVVLVWDYKKKKIIQRLKGHSDFIRSVDFHPTKPWIASVSDDCLLKVWDFTTGKLLNSTSGHTHYVMDVVFPDSNRIITASLDHTIALWDCSNLFEKKSLSPGVTLLQSVEAHDKGVNTLLFHNGRLLSGSDDKQVKVWMYKDDNLYLTATYLNHTSNVTKVFGEGSIYSVSEDSYLNAVSEGSHIKMNLGGRIWCGATSGAVVAVGMDDGLKVLMQSFDATHACDDSGIYYSLNGRIYKYNYRTSSEIKKVKGNVVGLQVVKGDLLIQYRGHYELKNKDHDGHGVHCNGDMFILQGDKLYKNEAVFMSFLSNSRIQRGNNGIFIISSKTVTFVSGSSKSVTVPSIEGGDRYSTEKSISVTVPFVVNDVIEEDGQIAILGQNCIHVFDTGLKPLYVVTEQIPITSCLFSDSVLFYSTQKQIKFYYEGKGILQSVDEAHKLVCFKDGALFGLNRSGIAKYFISLSEIRFRRAVIQDKDIVKVIQEEQIPGLSLINFLISKHKGAVAKPFIKDKDLLFDIYISEKMFEEAFSLCNKTSMLRKLATVALGNRDYTVAENCFKRLKDQTSLFYLYLCTKQFDKMDASMEVVQIVKSESDSTGNGQSNGRDECNHSTGSTGSGQSNGRDGCNSESKECGNNSHGHISYIGPENDSSSSCNSSDSTEQSNRDTDNDSNKHTDNVVDRVSSLNLNSKLFSQYNFKHSDPRSTDDIYNDALVATTQGKNSKAVSLFKSCILAIGSVIKDNGSPNLQLRSKIGRYFLALKLESSRRKQADPESNIRLALMLSTLSLEEEHIILSKNLAMTTCFKYGNYATAKQLAAAYPQCPNSENILESTEQGDRFKIVLETGTICYDTLNYEDGFTQCSLCFVCYKSKTGQCDACSIGNVC